MKKIYLSLVLTALLLACSEEDLVLDGNLLGLGGDTWVKSELDEWLYQEFIVPYNIYVRYKWDPSDVSYGKIVIPVDESKVKEIMSVVKKGWIRPYEAVAGGAFVRKLCPKSYVILGSPEYNSDNTMTLGFAEGGNKIVILDVNKFNSTSKADVKQALAVIFHEFSHILHQTVLYPAEFAAISNDGYNSNWSQTDDKAFGPLGFVTKYSRASPDEDFADIIRYITVDGKTAFNNYVNATAEPGKTRLRKKEAIVKNYFKQVWKIDLYETSPGANDGLSELVQQAITDIVAGL